MMMVLRLLLRPPRLPGTTDARWAWLSERWVAEGLAEAAARRGEHGDPDGLRQALDALGLTQSLKGLDTDAGRVSDRVNHAHRQGDTVVFNPLHSTKFDRHEPPALRTFGEDVEKGDQVLLDLVTGLIRRSTSYRRRKPKG